MFTPALSARTAKHFVKSGLYYISVAKGLAVLCGEFANRKDIKRAQ